MPEKDMLKNNEGETVQLSKVERQAIRKIGDEMKRAFEKWDDLIHQALVGECPKTFSGLMVRFNDESAEGNQDAS